MLLAIPRLVILLVCAALWPPGATMVITVLVRTGWMGVARLVRGEVRGCARGPSSRARRRTGRLTVAGALEARAAERDRAGDRGDALGVGSAMLLESGLSFLGLGIQPPSPSWGNMIADGRDLIVLAPWVALAPGLALIAHGALVHAARRRPARPARRRRAGDMRARS